MRLDMPVKLITTLLLLASCGDTPFNEDYWASPDGRGGRADQEDTTFNYTVDLRPLTPNVGSLDGRAEIQVTGNTVNSMISLTDVPHSVMQAHRSFTTMTCEELANTDFPQIPNPTGSFKAIEYNETMSRDALLSELNQGGLPPLPGSRPADLAGRRMVLSAFVMNTNTPTAQNATLIPVACGEIFFQQAPTTGGTVAGEVGGVQGTTAAGTVGGVAAGGVAGGIDGSVAGGGVGGVVGGIGGVAGGDGTATAGVVGGVGGAQGGVGGVGGVGGAIGAVQGGGGIDAGVGGAVGGGVGGVGGVVGAVQGGTGF
jgi:hypothetical protein